MPPGLRIVSCPSCSRVENAAFVELAYKVREMTAYAAHLPITIAVSAAVFVRRWLRRRRSSDDAGRRIPGPDDQGE